MTDDNNTTNNDKKPAPAPRLRRSRILPSLRPVNLRRFRKLLLRLGTSEEVVSMLPQITPYITRVLRLDRDRVITYLQMSPDSDVRKWLSVYERADIEDSLRRVLPYEVVCAAAKVPPLRLLECLGAMICRAGAQESAITAAIHHPQVVAATVGYALTEGGIQDRLVLHKATGFLPTPKGSTTTIQIQQQQVQQQAVALPVEPPIPEQTVRRLVNVFNRESGEPLAALPERTEAEYVPGPGDDDDDDEAVPVPVAISTMSPAAVLAKKFHDSEGGSSQE